MNLKKIKIIYVFGIFALTFLFHFMYNWFSNTFTSLIFPVNESIWEHMKLFFTGTLVYSIIDYILLKKSDIKFNNYLFQLFVTSVGSIIVYLSIYLPLYSLFGESMFISITLMFLVIVLEAITSYYLLKSKKYEGLNIISLVLLIFVFGLFVYFTYNPPRNYIFFDHNSEKYGIDIYK